MSDPLTKDGRYSIGRDDESGEVLVCDKVAHEIILRGGVIGMGRIEQLVQLANRAWKEIGRG